MSNLVRYSADNSRVPSGAIWNNIPLEALREFGEGFMCEDDFMGPHDLTNQYTVTQATAGTAALIDQPGGICDLDCASGTATQGVQIQYASSVGERFLPKAGEQIAFECRLAVSDLTAGTSGPEFFAGLSVIDTSIIDSSAVSAAQYVGFSSITDDGVLLSATYDGTLASGTGTSLATSAAGIANATWLKLGFVIDSTDEVRFYVNGVLVDTETSNIPDTAGTDEMTVSFVCQSDGTVDPIVHLDWWRCAQVSPGYV